MKSSVSIGRSDVNDIVLDAPQVSSRHAVLSLIKAEPPRYLLRDLGSTNGTFKNGERITVCEIGPDDSVHIANIALDPELYRSRLTDVVDQTASRQAGDETSYAPAVSPLTGAGSGSVAWPKSNILLPLFLFVILWVVLYVLSGLPASVQMWQPGNSALQQLTGSFVQMWQPGTFSLQQLMGAFLVAVALVQLGYWLRSRERRLNYQRQQEGLALDLWTSRVESVRRRQVLEPDQATAWKGLRKFEVARKVQEGGGITSFYLVPHDRKSLSPFKPGQYLTFSLKIPGQAQPVVRCYSLSDSPTEREYYRVSIKRCLPPRGQPDVPPGLSSSFFHDQIESGDILDVRAPGGHFFLDLEKDTPVVLIGGGVGITPVLSMLNAVIEHAQHRETWFFYGVRNHEEHIMEEHLRSVAQEHANVRLHVCYSQPDDEDVEGVHYHHAERVSVDLFKRLLPSNNFEFYICGPSQMMDSVTTDLEAWGVPKEHIHFEAFGPASTKKVTHGEGTAKPAASGEQFQVQFAKSGKRCQWQPDSGSLLDLAEANGVAIDFGCRAGNCGTCLVAVREGKVDYLHAPGVEPEAGSCLTCIGRPAGDPGQDTLVLDA